MYRYREGNIELSLSLLRRVRPTCFTDSDSVVTVADDDSDDALHERTGRRISVLAHIRNRQHAVHPPCLLFLTHTGTT